MSFEISLEDKKLFNQASIWIKSNEPNDKQIGEYLLEQLIHKYLNELIKTVDDSSELANIDKFFNNLSTEELEEMLIRNGVEINGN